MIRLIRSLHILPRWLVLLIDIFVLTFSVLLAYLLRFNFDLAHFLSSGFALGSISFLICSVAAILFTKSYSGIIRHTGVQDGYRIVYTSTLGIILTLILNYIYRYQTGVALIPLGVIVMAYLNSITFLIAYRMLVKYIFAYYSRVVKVYSKVLIFGAGKTGQLTKQMIDADTDSSVKPIAFLEDNLRKVRKVIDGIPIHNARKDLARLIDVYGIDELIIATPNLSLKRKNEIVDLCLSCQVKVRSVPPVERWIKGELSLNQIKDINIEDLLGRESIKINNSIIENETKGKTILITGAAGSIGSELVRQILRYRPLRVVLLDQAESALYELDNELNAFRNQLEIIPLIGDVCNLTRLKHVFSVYKPEIVFHAAAYKHVPLMEHNPSEAVLCNILGTKNVADLSVVYQVRKFVMISTDKAVNPTSVMGASKRIAEMYVQSYNNSATNSGSTAFITTRFGNVLGSNGSVIPLFKKQIEKRLPLTVTHPEITRYFMTIPEACELVLEAAVMGNGGEIYIFDMGQSIKIANLAKKMIQLSGLELDKDIEIKYTGLRPGEKLYEELLNNKENTVSTHHSKILIAKVKEEKFEQVNDAVENLVSTAKERNDFKLVSLMKSMVPEYISNSSVYESLDGLETIAALPVPTSTERQ